MQSLSATSTGTSSPRPLRSYATSDRSSVKPFHILLVDDEIEVWWELCITALRRSGHEVDTAQDGESGWDALRLKNYDLLITDNRCPESPDSN